MPAKKPATKTKPKISQQTINYLLIGLLIGFLLLAVVRFIAYQPPKHTHYHANWSVWINGEEQKFSDPSFYEETVSCSTTTHDEDDPTHRSHMHEQQYNIVHVHADAVTWGQFLENINSAAQPSYLRIHNSTYENNENSKVTYTLNGKQLDSLNGIVIGDQDKLLINYSNESAEVIQQRYDAIQNNAKQHDEEKDPASCSGDEETTIWDRLKTIFN